MTRLVIWSVCRLTHLEPLVRNRGFPWVANLVDKERLKHNGLDSNPVKTTSLYVYRAAAHCQDLEHMFQ